MIVLFTDFGFEGPYVGQMKAVLRREAPEVPVIDLMHDGNAADWKGPEQPANCTTHHDQVMFVQLQ